MPDKNKSVLTCTEKTGISQQPGNSKGRVQAKSTRYLVNSAPGKLGTNNLLIRTQNQNLVYKPEKKNNNNRRILSYSS